MERYDSYKDSGVEWIGEIPESWSIHRIKNHFTVISGATPKGANDEIWHGSIPWITPSDYTCVDHYISEGSRRITKIGYESCGTILVPQGSIIVSNRAPIGKVVLSKNPLCTNQGCKALVAKDKINANYVYWTLTSQDGALQSFGQGTTFLELSTLAMQQYPIAFPNLHEQEVISAYLDEKTSLIDSLIKKTEKSIKLFQEYRKSIISEAVTKGLDPNVPMKDSGVEWIGEIPKDWDVARIKSIVRSVDEESIDVPLHAIMLEDIQSWTGKLISESDPNNIESNSRSFIRGDILFSKLRPYLAKAITAPFDGVCSGELLVLRSTVLVHKFLFYFLLSFGFIDEINAATYGAKMPRANWNIVGLTFLSYPEKEEQIAIAEYLDAKTVEIDSLIEKKKQLVEKLQEYRKSLISECVTGKVKVPGVE